MGTRRVADLVECGATVDVVAPVVTPELLAWADEGRINVQARPFEDADLDGAWLALAATDDPAVNQAVLDAAATRRCFASSATPAPGGGNGLRSAPSLRPMAVLRRGALEVAVGTSGRSPALAAWLRDRLSGQLGPEYAALVELAGEARLKGPGSGRFRTVPERYGTVDPSILEAIRAGRWDEAREGLRT